MAAWHDSDVKPEAVLAAVWLAAVTVLAGIILYRVIA